ncbi:MAG: DUF1571 domain-containing protein [Planctomycetes bacterium]|nr:DUF1571 domain-containing protein [Planctomycetota bacterium]
MVLSVFHRMACNAAVLFVLVGPAVSVERAAGQTPASNQVAVSEPATVSPLLKQHDILRQQIAGAVSFEAKVAGPAAAEHPLMPVLRYALETHGKLSAKVQDYKCRLVKRERIDGRLLLHEVIDVKLRQPGLSSAGSPVPMGVYMKWFAPTKIEGREVVWTQGKNYNNLMATKGGEGNLRTFTLTVPLKSPRAMERTRYPISEIGMLNLAERLIQDGVKHMELDSRRECQVRVAEGAKIDGRVCRFIEVVFPVQRDGIKFHKAQIFVDQQLEMPVRYAAYSWPKEAGAEPPLLEEFTYVNVKLNVGLTDQDFNPKNPAYKFFVPEE